MSRDIRKLPLYQSDASYNATLTLIKERAADKTHDLSFYDCTARGSKNTECTLGLCDDSIEETMDGVYKREHHTCPHDSRYFDGQGNRLQVTEYDINGCFYTCRIFSPSKAMKKRGRAEREFLARQRVANANLIPAGVLAGGREDDAL